MPYLLIPIRALTTRRSNLRQRQKQPGKIVHMHPRGRVGAIVDIEGAVVKLLRVVEEIRNCITLRLLRSRAGSVYCGRGDDRVRLGLRTRRESCCPPPGANSRVGRWVRRPEVSKSRCLEGSRPCHSPEWRRWQVAAGETYTRRCRRIPEAPSDDVSDVHAYVEVPQSRVKEKKTTPRSSSLSLYYF